MIKIINSILILFFISLLSYSSVMGAPSQSGTDEQVITSTGTQIVTFDKWTSEINIVRTSTNTIYVDWYTTGCTSTTYSESWRTGSTIDKTVEANTSTMSIFTLEIPVNIKVRGRSNRSE